MTTMIFTRNPIRMLPAMDLAPTNAELCLQPTSAVLDCDEPRVSRPEIYRAKHRMPPTHIPSSAFRESLPHSKTIQYP